MNIITGAFVAIELAAKAIRVQTQKSEQLLVLHTAN
jgi:hypothetical protein